MDVASLCPLPVGVVRWQSPGRSLTVIVKMTLSLAGSEAALGDPQDPLSIDRPIEGGSDDELYYASDFAPRKARCDVLLAGRARAAAPAPVIPVRVAVGDLDLRFFAMAGAPSHAIPLSAAYLRARPVAASQQVMVAPRSPRSPERARAKGSALLGPHGAPLGPLDQGFDFGVFNAASPGQQVSAIRPGAVITLEGLLPGAPSKKLQLPSERPRVYYARGGAREGAFGRASPPPLSEVLLRCDTLWIDVDRAVCALVWRGEIAVPEGVDEPDLLVATLAPFGLGESLPAVQARVERAPRVRAVEVSDAEGGGGGDDRAASAPAEAEESAARGARRRGKRGTLVTDDEVTRPHVHVAKEGPGAPAEAPSSQRSGPGALGAFRLGGAGALGALGASPAEKEKEGASARGASPEEGAAEEIEAEEIDLDEVAVVAEEPTSPAGQGHGENAAVKTALPFRLPPELRNITPGSALPFRPAPSAPAEPLAPPPSAPRAPLPPPAARAAADAAGSEPEGEALRTALPFRLPPELLNKAPLPFRAPEDPAVLPPRAQAQPATVPLPISPPPAPSVSPPPAPSRPSSPPLLPLETYAAIQLEVWEEAAPLDEILEQYGLNEIAWRENEQRRAAALADEASEGRSDLALALADALKVARARRAVPVEDGSTLDDYIALRVALDDAAEVTSALEARGMTIAAWQKLSSKWRKRAMADPVLRSAIQVKLAEARKAASGPASQ